MTDTTNTLPPVPEYPVKGLLRDWYTTELQAILAYGDARAAHAVAQIKAREVTDAEIDAMHAPDDFGARLAWDQALEDALDGSFTAATDDQPSAAPVAPDEVVRPYGACSIQGPAEDVSFILRRLPDVDDGEAMHLAQIKALNITGPQLDALLLDEIGFEPETSQWVNRDDLHRIVRAAIALANKKG